MSLPARSTRNVLIDGVACRWKLTHPKGERPSLLVQATTGGGRLLVIETTRVTDGTYWLCGKCGAIATTDVVRAAGEAKALGWAPDQPGKPVRIDYAGRLVGEP